MTKKLNPAGYTIVELLVALTIFSSILLLTTLTLTQIASMYYKGINSSRTQEAARTAIASITEEVQFSNASYSDDGGTTIAYPVGPLITRTATTGDNNRVRSECVGNARFSFIINRSLNPNVANGYDDAAQQIRHVLWQDARPASGDCIPVDLTQLQPSPNGRELLGENMRLTEFDVGTAIGESRVITIGVLYGDKDLLARETAGDETTRATGCEGGVVGSQWCAYSLLETQATRRLQ